MLAIPVFKGNNKQPFSSKILILKTEFLFVGLTFVNLRQKQCRTKRFYLTGRGLCNLNRIQLATPVHSPF